MQILDPNIDAFQNSLLVFLQYCMQSRHMRKILKQNFTGISAAFIYLCPMAYTQGKNRLLRIVATEQSSFCLYNTSTRVPSPFSIVPSFSAFFPRSTPFSLSGLRFHRSQAIPAYKSHTGAQERGQKEGGEGPQSCLIFLRSKTDQEKHNIFPMQEKNESNASLFVPFLLKRFRRICPC